MGVFHAQFLDGSTEAHADFGDVALVPVDAGGKPDTIPLDPPFWTNARDITTIEEDPLVSEDLNSKTITFAPQHSGYVETFDVPHGIRVEEIATDGVFGSRFFECSHEFDVSEVTHSDGSGNEIRYRRYEDNRGYAADERRIRILFRRV